MRLCIRGLRLTINESIITTLETGSVTWIRIFFDEPII